MSESDGERSPLLSGTPTPTLHDSDEDSYNPRDPRASVSWLIPAVVMATFCNALTTFSRHVFFREFVCEEIGGLPDMPDPSLLQIDAVGFSRLDCSSPPYLSGTLTINVASMIATSVFSAFSTGWWSRLGDMHGRRYPLMTSVLGSILLNLVFVLIASSPALEGLVQPCIFLALLLEGFLGGSATFYAAVHAYTADVAPAGSWSTLFSLLQGLVILLSIMGNWIGFGADILRPFLSFSLASAIGVVNLAFVFFFLPESLPEESQLDRPLKVAFKDIKKSIYSTVTVFLTGHRLVFFGLAFFFYSLTSSLESFQLLFAFRRDPTTAPLTPGLFLMISPLTKMVTFLIVFPAMLHFFKRRSPLSFATSTKQYFFSVMTIDGSAARYLVSANLVSQLLIIVFPTSLSAMFFLLALMTPLSAGIKPAMYALSAVYSEVLGGAPRRGALFGAISVLGTVGETISHLMYVSTYNIFWRAFAKAGFMLTAALLALVAIFLWPSEPERIPRDSAERIRIVVPDEGVTQDPSTFSPVYRRHGVAGHPADGH
ncbi:hypothetical protein DFH07DRAFT_481450 [Mycena maculata]|uniref:Major facilitator superfamily (MFS) profile domain-containing protein n=1 Tax=Mycena maculata TaxID=230809 RepID=A0AAD7J747_9AGAR|nr:hypothetical protein DFH07DRAFT_481450 [Mycena maculata]